MTNLGPNADLIGKPGSRSALATPALLLELDVFERNIRLMADYCREHGIALRPHSKTHKSVEIARRQIEAGAVGICTATLGEAEIMVGSGIPGVLVTTPIVSPRKIDRLMALNGKAKDLMVVVDVLENVDALAEAAKAAGRPLQMVVAFDAGIKRIGTPDPERAVELARRIDGADTLVFAGIHAYNGGLQHIEDYAERRQKADIENGRIADLKARLEKAGLPPPRVSGSGTGTHDIDAEANLFDEFQAGSYIFTDVEYNVVALRRDEPRPFTPSLFVMNTVVSASHDEFLTIDGGIKWYSTGGAMPEIARGAPTACRYQFRGDERANLFFEDPTFRLPVGATIEFIPPHCDPTVNLHNVYHVVRGDTLVDIWPVDARGAL